MGSIRALSEPEWKCAEDVQLFLKYQDSLRLTQFLMTLKDEFLASLLHRSPLPSLDSAVSKLISEEIRLQTLHLSIPGISRLMAATPCRQTSKIFTRPNKVARNASNGQSTGFMEKCSFCNIRGHKAVDCRKIAHLRAS